MQVDLGDNSLAAGVKLESRSDDIEVSINVKPPQPDTWNGDPGVSGWGALLNINFCNIFAVKPVMWLDNLEMLLQD